MNAMLGWCFWTGLLFPSAATTPTKCRVVGGVDEAIQARYCERYFWTGLLFPGAATTPTKAGIVGGVDEAMATGCCERHPRTSPSTTEGKCQEIGSLSTGHECGHAPEDLQERYR